MPSYAFDKFEAVTIKSQAGHLPGQDHRSSDNYDLRALKHGAKIRFNCPQGIVFNVKEDKTAATDPVTYSDVTNGTVVPFPSDSACNGFYIADPKNASGAFLITIETVP